MVDQRLGHLTRKTAVGVPLLLDCFGELFHAPDALRQIPSGIFQPAAPLLQRCDLFIILFISLFEFFIGQRSIERQFE